RGRPRPVAVVHAAVVGELEERERAVRVDRPRDASEVRDRRLVPRDRVVVHLIGSGRVDLRLPRDDDPGAAAGALGEVAAVALAVESGLAPGVRRLRVHREVRTHDDAVARLDGTDAQGREQVRVRHGRTIGRGPVDPPLRRRGVARGGAWLDGAGCREAPRSATGCGGNGSVRPAQRASTGRAPGWKLEGPLMRTIVVTGSASGIGAAVRARLTAAGDTVIGVDLREAEVRADLASAAGRTGALAAIALRWPDGVDGRVVCARGGPAGPDRGLVVALNLFGAQAILAGTRELLARRRGTAVAISSNSSSLPGADTGLAAACLADDEPGARRLATTLAGPQVYAGAK